MPTKPETMGNIDEFKSIEKFTKQRHNIYRTLEIVGTTDIFENWMVKDLYTKVLNCGTSLQFGVDSKGITHLIGGNFCRNRICPMCQFRRAEKLFSQAIQIVEKMEQDGFRFLHLVLTVPNPQDERELVETIKNLYKSFGKFWKYKEVKKAYKGAIRCLEISYNYERCEFHPHLHCLIAVKKSYFTDSKVYLKYDRIMELWAKACKSERLYQVSVRAVKEGDYRGVAEVCKYSVKPLDFDDTQEQWQNERIILNLGWRLKGTRLLQKYGVLKDEWRQMFGADETEDDDTEFDTKQMFDYTFSYEWTKNGYERS